MQRIGLFAFILAAVVMLARLVRKDGAHMAKHHSAEQSTTWERRSSPLSTLSPAPLSSVLPLASMCLMWGTYPCRCWAGLYKEPILTHSSKAAAELCGHLARG